MKIYTFLDYRKFLKQRMSELPKTGRGELLKIAKAANVHPSVLSQVFQGKRDFTPEQAIAVAEYFGLSDTEARYFLLLVQYERAGTPKLKTIYKNELKNLRSLSTEISHRITSQKVLSPEEKAVFYSNWFYSAARILTSVPLFQNIESISQKLGLPRKKTTEIIEFLLERGLCVERNGKIMVGPQSTHISAASPLVARHHGNWRVKAMERHPSLSPDREFAFTSPMTLSKGDVAKVREILLQATEDACAIVDSSKSETAYCLNLDWFEIEPE